MNSRSLQWIAVMLIAVVVIIHLRMVPEEYDEATYMGILFVVNFIAAAIATVGLLRGATWGWLLGAMIAGGSALSYILSRSVGLPGMEVERWLAPLGVVSLIAEGVFLVIAATLRP